MVQVYMTRYIYIHFSIGKYNKYNDQFDEFQHGDKFIHF